MNLPRHGWVSPIFRSRFFFLPASGDAAGSVLGGRDLVVRSAPPPGGGDGGKESVRGLFPFGLAGRLLLEPEPPPLAPPCDPPRVEG